MVVIDMVNMDTVDMVNMVLMVDMNPSQLVPWSHACQTSSIGITVQNSLLNHETTDFGKLCKYSTKLGRK